MKGANSISHNRPFCTLQARISSLNRTHRKLQDDRGDAGRCRQARAEEKQDQGQTGSSEQITGL